MKKYESILYELRYQIIFYRKNINTIASSVYILGKTMASYYLQFSTRITDGLVWIQIMKRYMSVAGDDCIDVNADLLLRISLLHEFLYLTRNLTNGKSSGKELRPRGTENLTNTHWNGSTLFACLFRQRTHVGKQLYISQFSIQQYGDFVPIQHMHFYLHSSLVPHCILSRNRFRNEASYG